MEMKKKGLRIKKYYLKRVTNNDQDILKSLMDKKAIQVWIKNYLMVSVDDFNKVTRSYAFKVSSAVLFSPNSFLDGITILYGNANMIYTLSKKVHIRYTLRDMWQMYFSVMSVASISGLIEEYDDFLIDMFEELLEDLGEKMGEEAGKAITDAIPVVNIAAKTTSFLIQSAGNYAFVIYNGRRFKKMVENVYLTYQMTMDEINTEARKEARKSKITYVKELSVGFAEKVKKKKI